jgi:hypothetical protein
MEHNINELFSLFPTYTQKQKNDLIEICNNDTSLKYGSIDYLVVQLDVLCNHIINYMIIQEYIKFCAELDMEYTRNIINKLSVETLEKDIAIRLVNDILDKILLEQENKRLREELNYYKPLDKANQY